MSANTNLATGESRQPATPKFYVVSINKLVALSLITSNLYGFYWFYRNWSIYRAATGEQLVPLLRSIIPVLFIYPLLNRVDRGLKDSGHDFQWSPMAISLGMWGVIIAGYASNWFLPTPSELAPPPVSLWVRMLLEMFVYMATLIWLFCLMQRAINVHENDPSGQANSQITAANWVWISFGVVSWVVFIAIVTIALFGSLWWEYA